MYNDVKIMQFPNIFLLTSLNMNLLIKIIRDNKIVNW